MENLVKKSSKPPLKFYTNITKKFHKTLKPKFEKVELLSIIEEGARKLLRCLDASKAPRLDKISSKFIKIGAELLVTPTSDLIISSIKLSTFPNKCKLAKLKPLFKKGLKVIFLIIEKSVHVQTQEYLDSNGLLYKFSPFS